MNDMEDIIKQKEREGWRYKNTLYETILVFEREIPEQVSPIPTQQETEIAVIEDGCACCNNDTIPPTDAWDN
jgi:hypothetical protein